MDLDVVVARLGLSTSSEARELSSFAFGAQLLSVPELEAAREEWPDVLVFSEVSEPTGVLTARLEALDGHPAIRNVALVGAGAGVGVGATAIVGGVGSPGETAAFVGSAPTTASTGAR